MAYNAVDDNCRNTHLYAAGIAAFKRRRISSPAICACGRPDVGVVIPSSGGLRKTRWGMSGRGKRGGVRVIYYWAAKQERILMLLIYPKNVKDDLAREQLKILRTIVKEEFP